MAKKEIGKEQLDILDQLGVDIEVQPERELSKLEERVLAGFEDITRWAEREGRAPQHGDDLDIFERMYAIRLDRIRELTKFHELLNKYDPLGLLSPASAKAEENSLALDTEEDILSALGVEPIQSDITNLRHVRSADERRASADEVASRKRCEDFAEWAPLFERARLGLDTGAWKTTPYQANVRITPGNFYILEGQTLYVASAGKEFRQEYGDLDQRLRVIYDNGTEYEPLRRSLRRALTKDKTSRRLRPDDAGPLFSDVEEAEDRTTGYLYVLRSLSNNSWISEHRDLVHKIGVTTGSVEMRIAGAAKDATYLLADVEIVKTYKLANIIPHKLEALVQRFFDSVRLDLELRDRFDMPVHPREWFLAPKEEIDRVIQLIQEGTIGRYRYDKQQARVVER